MNINSHYAIVPHMQCGEPTGQGYVVRPSSANGTVCDQYNYRGASVVAVYKREHNARLVCRKLNGEG